MARDYIAAFLAKPSDGLWFGRKGMKWGVRRSSAELRSAGPVKKDSTGEKASTSSSAVKKPAGNIQDNVESSSSRYDRIAGTAKSGRAHELTEADLKFFNARTEALGKIAKLNEVKPSWLKDTATKVAQQTAQNQMQAVADGVAKKFISGPILDSLNAAGGASKAASTPKVADAIKAKVEETKAKADVETPALPPYPGREAAIAAAAATGAAVPSYPGTGPAIPQASTTPKPSSQPRGGSSPLAGQTFKEAMADIRKRAKDYNNGA